MSTRCDLNDLANSYFEKGKGYKMYQWMLKNAQDYGFYLVYTETPNRKGFKYEPWHFSYAPVSKSMLQEYKKLNLRTILQEDHILGSDYFSEEFIQKYRTENILDINPELL